MLMCRDDGQVSLLALTLQLNSHSQVHISSIQDILHIHFCSSAEILTEEFPKMQIIVELMFSKSVYESAGDLIDETIKKIIFQQTGKTSLERHIEVNILILTSRHGMVLFIKNLTL